MLNKVMLIGRLGSDPDIKYSANGGAPFGRFSVATDDSYTDREGKKVERTEWVNVFVNQRLAENCQTFLSKGSLVYVEGTLTTRKWEDREGQTRYTTEVRAQRVIFLDRKSDRGQDGWGRNESENMDEGAPRGKWTQGGSAAQGRIQDKGQSAKSQGAKRNIEEMPGEDQSAIYGGSESAQDQVPF